MRVSETGREGKGTGKDLKTYTAGRAGAGTAVTGAAVARAGRHD